MFGEYLGHLGGPKVQGEPWGEAGFTQGSPVPHSVPVTLLPAPWGGNVWGLTSA